MDLVLLSICTMLGLGMVASVLLVVASRVFYVQENPKVIAALEILPGANCGGCGFAGCEGYAKAVVLDPEIPANRCCAAPKESIVALAEITGKVVADAEPQVAMRRCDVNHGSVAQCYEYQGIPSCAAASPLRGGMNACAFSCLGFGDCVQACPFGAMSIVGNLACVDIHRCTGCGNCVAACPRNILELIPQRSRVCIPCNSRNKGKAVMDACKIGCIKCGKCIRLCPAKAIRLDNSYIKIDHQLCLSFGGDCGQACVKGCSRKILRTIDLLNPVPEVVEEPAEEQGGQKAA